MSNVTSLEQLPDALEQLLKDYLNSSFEVRQQALQEGAEVFKSAIERETPVDTGEMARSWVIKTKYRDRRYVGNTKVVQGGGKDRIPLSNILEYSQESPCQGFIRRCFDNTEAKIYQTIKNKLKNGGN